MASGVLKYNYSCCQERKRDASPQQTHTPELVFLIYRSPLSLSLPFKIEREGSGCFYAPLCSFQECLQCLPGIPACWLWFGIKGAASSAPSADPKGDYVGLNVSPFVGRHAGSDRFPCTVLLFFRRPRWRYRAKKWREECWWCRNGENIFAVEEFFQRSEGFCVEKLIPGLNRPQLKYR